MRRWARRGRLAGIVVQGAKAAGFGFGHVFGWDVFSSVLGTRFGEVWAAQAGLAAAILVLRVARAEDPGPAPAALPAADAVAVRACQRLGRSPTGHRRRARDRSGSLGRRAGRSRPRPALGGRERWELAVSAVPRFSGFAVVAVSWLIASGTVSGYMQVRALRGLWIRPTASSYSSRSHSSCRCSRSASTTTVAQFHACASGGDCGGAHPFPPHRGG